MRKFSAFLLTLALVVPAARAQADTAEVQVIHNAADPAAAEVDVYLGDVRILDDFAFRTATPFLEVPAGVNLAIGIAPGGSNGVDDVIADFSFELERGNRYVLMASGVLDPAAFAQNPGGAGIGFDLLPADGIRTRSFFGFVKLKAFHGATDAPAVDIRVQSEWGSWPLFGNLGYGEFSPYRSLYGKSYVLDVTPAGDAGTVVASFNADLTDLRNGAAIVFASGFLNPMDNQDGLAFGLFAALPDGQVLPLTAANATAELQVIHNAADPAAALVDIYVNDELTLEDFAFRSATPFLTVPAGVNLNIGVAPAGSDDAEDVIADFDVSLERGKRYVAMANGVLNPDDFAANPEGASIGFDLFTRDGIMERAYLGRVELLAFHGATDAPAVDIRRRTSWGGSRVLFGDLSYGEYSRYKSLRARSYVLDVTPAGEAGTVVASYLADLSDLRNGAAVVFASGFLGPVDNQDGAAFGLFAALADGTVLGLPVVDAPAAHDDDVMPDSRLADAGFDVAQNYPNPFNPMTTIAFSIPRASFVSVKVYNVRGEMVRDLLQEPRSAGRHEVSFDGRDMASGMYFYRVDAGEFSATRGMMLVK